MGATDRVRQYIDFKGITKYRFCRDLEFSNKFLDNSSNMGTDKACKILRHYPDMNPEWLITGDGDMLRTSTPARSESPTSYVAPKEESSDSIAMLLRDMLREKDELLARQQEEIGRLKAELAAAEAKLAELDYHDSDDAPDVPDMPTALVG